MTTFLFLAMAAAPGPPLKNTPPPDHGRLAARIGQVIDQVGEQYYRPVSAERLYGAAALALYASGKRPAPGDLPAKVRTAMLKPRAVNADDDPRVRLLADAVGEAGDDPLVTACRAIARELDPHSGLITAEEQRRSVGLDHESFGVGLELREPGDVEAVAYGGPAQQAGMRPGDRVTRVNGVAVDRLTPDLTLALRNERVRSGPGLIGSDEMQAELPSVLRVHYRRGDEPAERTAVLFRGQFRPETVLGAVRTGGNGWSYWLDERARLAHVRLTNLSRGTADELRAVLETLTERKARGLVLDLRWCPGGYLNEAVDVADLFLGEKVIATVKARGREDVIHRSGGKPAFADAPLVVLVNAETSGGAELIAAALQDHGRVVVVGQRTRGKASVQTPLSVGQDGYGFKLTSGTFLRPSGKNLHRSPDSKAGDDWGVIPTEDWRVSPGLAGKYARAWQLWSLRPVGAAERLELDDPAFDTQRSAAAAVLRREVAQRR